MKKILLYGDFVACPTGFATVTRNLAKEWHKHGWLVDQVAINYLEGDKVDDIPYINYYRAAMTHKDNDVYGQKTILGALNGMKGTNTKFSDDYDILFLLQDPFVVKNLMKPLTNLRDYRRKNGGKDFKIVWYAPIDGKQMQDWLHAMNAVDAVIPFSAYGVQEIRDSAEHYLQVNADIQKIYSFLINNTTEQKEKTRLSEEKKKHLESLEKTSASLKRARDRQYKYIYHGTNLKDFYEVDQSKVDEFMKTFFNGLVKDKFLISCVNRNQPRKDIPRVIEIFANFKEKHPESFLYLNMDSKDPMGVDLSEVCSDFGLLETIDYATFNTFSRDYGGVTTEDVNMIYNCSDVTISATIGEGWGLSATEAMAAGCPVILPNNTTAFEILGNDRGILYDLEMSAIYRKDDFSRPRLRADVQSGVEALERVYSMKMKEVDVMVEQARRWVQGHTWEAKAQEFIGVFNELLEQQTINKTDDE